MHGKKQMVAMMVTVPSMAFSLRLRRTMTSSSLEWIEGN
jgi:hypothetical protein